MFYSCIFALLTEKMLAPGHSCNFLAQKWCFPERIKYSFYWKPTATLILFSELFLMITSLKNNTKFEIHLLLMQFKWISFFLSRLFCMKTDAFSVFSTLYHYNITEHRTVFNRLIMLSGQLSSQIHIRFNLQRCVARSNLNNYVSKFRNFLNFPNIAY